MEYTYEDEIRITSEFLDNIDILAYIPSNKKWSHYSLDDLIRDLENNYENNYHGLSVPNDDFFEGCLFNRMSREEFEDYLQERYGRDKLHFTEITTTYLSKTTNDN